MRQRTILWTCALFACFAVLNAVNPMEHGSPLLTIFGELPRGGGGGSRGNQGNQQLTVDQILEMLNNLKQATRESLESLRRSHEEEEGSTKLTIGKLYNSYDLQTQKCALQRQKVERLNDSINLSEEAIINNDLRIKDVDDIITRLNTRLCTSNSLFMEYLKNSKETLQALNMIENTVRGGGHNGQASFIVLPTLLEFAYPVKSKFNPEEADLFAEMQDLLSQHPSFNPDSADAPNITDNTTQPPSASDNASGSQLPSSLDLGDNTTNTSSSDDSGNTWDSVTRRNHTGNGTGHHHNPRDRLDIPTTGETSDKLLRLIEIIREKLKESFSDFEDLQLEIADAAMEYRLSLERETKYLDSESREADKYVDSVFTLEQLMEAELEDCGKLQGEFQTNLNLLQDTIKNGQADYDLQAQKKKDELSLIDDIVRLYMNQVVKQKGVLNGPQTPTI